MYLDKTIHALGDLYRNSRVVKKRVRKRSRRIVPPRYAIISHKK